MRRSFAVVALVPVLVVLGAGGCSSGERPAASTTSGASSVEPTTTSTPTTTPAEEPLPCVPDVEPFTGPAAEAFSAERVMAAYCLLVDLVEQQESTTLALPVPEQAPRDLRPMRRVLTPAAAAGWERLIAARAAGGPRAGARIDGLTLHDVRRVPSGYARADDGPYVFGTQVGPATAGLARGGAALELTFTLETGLVLEAEGYPAGRHSLLPVTREATYVLVPRGDGWLVDDWKAEFSHGPVRLVSG